MLYYRQRLISSLMFLLFLGTLTGAVSAAVSGLPIKLRSQIAPTCSSSSGASLRYADLFGEGNTAVMGSYGCRGAFIFDISNPGAPVLANWYNPGSNLQFLEAVVVDRRGYFGSGNGGGVHIVDLTNPYSPVVLGIVNSTNGNGHNSIHEMVVFKQNGMTFLIENSNSLSNKILKIINVTNPAAPVLVRDLNPTEPQWVHAMVVKGDRLFTSGWGNSSNRGRTEIYNIANITTTPPVLLGFIADLTTVTAGNSMHSAWPSEDGNFLYSAREIGSNPSTSPGDIRVYDISDPSVPLLVKKIPTVDLGINASTPHNPVVKGNKLYVSWYQAGLQVFDISNPRSPRRIGEYDTYLPAFNEREFLEKRAESAQYEPWDMVCGRSLSTDASISGYDGAWAVYPFLGDKKLLVGDLASGLFILDSSRFNIVTDFDGDFRTDISVFRPSSGDWQMTRSSDDRIVDLHFGLAGDVMVPGDYDGDGSSDLAVFRPATGIWYMQGSTSGFGAIQFGTEGDVPVAADYDADGKTDVAVWRPSTGAWYIQQSTAGFKAVQWGSAGDKALAGDYDGDGLYDIAVWRPSSGTWYILPSGTSTPMFQNFGVEGDRPVVADFDANGVSDITVFRPSDGTWYIYDPWTTQFRAVQFGAAEDMPIPADYDGDGLADVAVYRPSSQAWYRLNSSDGSVASSTFGMAGDVPAPFAAQPD